MTESKGTEVTTGPNNEKAQLPIVAEYVPAEMFLENIGFFTPSSTRIKQHTEKEKVLGEKLALDGTKKTIRVSVSANAKLGLPITSDLDYYRAFLKILDEVADADRHVDLPIRVPSKRLAQFAGKGWGGKTKAEINEWFERMNFTGIKGGMYRAKMKTYEDGFSGVVFAQIVRRGERLKDGTVADTNYVWPSPWFLSNYHYHYVRPVDLNFHRRLTRPIAKALYPLLETGWYASNCNPYSKSYHDLCTEFLLREEVHLSDIKRQLNPAHEELQREQFLDSWDFREGAGKGSYVIVYYPGLKFFQDQKARKERFQLAARINQDPRDAVPGAQETPPMHLVAAIVEITKDRHSLRYYRKVVKELSEHTVYELISLTKQAVLEGRVRTDPARYFTDLAKRAMAQAQKE